MAISIASNPASLSAGRSINEAKSGIEDSFDKLSSGRRINKASTDPANLAVAIELLANVKTSAVASRNISDGISVAAIAEGSLSTAGEITGRMGELATQAANGTLSDSQRSVLNQEYQALSSELDRISGSTEFNGRALLDGSGSMSLQVGTDSSANSQIQMSLPGVSSAQLGLAADISTQQGAMQAIDQTKASIESITTAQAEIGSVVSRLESAYDNLKISELNQQAAASRIMDTDVAAESANFIANNIRLKASVAIQAQANTIPQTALTLLR